ncbi:MAG: hypothetical protein HZB16_23265 [Armatimonadetes bacterium]|nr:hypothetical protein [Armatimonadota bacterium]
MRTALVLGCLLTLPTVAAEDFAPLLARYRATLGGAPASAADRIASQRPDGSWADVDYASGDRSNWGASKHVGHLRAIAAVNPPTVAATQALNRGLDYWRQHDFTCPNWWYNEIGVPMTMADIGVLAYERISPENLRYLTGTVLPRAKIGMTGQNRAWVAGITFIRGLLVGDSELASRAMGVVMEELVVSGAEGLQPDWSFHQHGPQQQFGNYGLAFAGDMSRWADLLRGSTLAVAPEKISLLRNYVLNGENWVCWRGYMDLSSCDRQITPGAMRGKGRSVAGINTRMVGVDPEQAAAYRAGAQRNQPGAVNDLVGTRYFWRSDYLIHRRPEFMASLKMASRRVIGAELVNSENVSGYYLADGALFCYRAGDELEDVAPVWDWRRVPGVTCPQGTRSLRPPGNHRLPSDYVGAACDGQNGVVMLDLARDGLSVRKLFCFAGDQVVCLGAGLSYPGAEPVTTSLWQQRLRGPVKLSAGGAARELATGQETIADAQWLEHDGMRLTLLEPARLVVQTGPKTGHWRNVFTTSGTPRDDVTLPLCSAWLDHGTNPSGTFAYSLGTPTAGPAKIISNTALVQAVRMPGGLVGATFWAAGRLDLGDGHSLATDLPCAVLFDPATGTATVAEPTQKFRTLTLTVDGVARAVTLPVGLEAGASVVVKR